MTTYCGFIIHDNLRCYIDDAGKLEPKFITTEFKTLDEAKARIDKYNEEWIQWQARRQVNYAKSLQVLRADTDQHDESQQLDADKFNEKVEQYFDHQLNEK